jgi:hypothetical protein
MNSEKVFAGRSLRTSSTIGCSETESRSSALFGRAAARVYNLRSLQMCHYLVEPVILLVRDAVQRLCGRAQEAMSEINLIPGYAQSSDTRAHVDMRLTTYQA